MAEHNISGKKVAFLLTDGVEQVELTSPWNAVKEAGATARSKVRAQNRRSSL